MRSSAAQAKLLAPFTDRFLGTVDHRFSRVLDVFWCSSRFRSSRMGRSFWVPGIKIVNGAMLTKFLHPFGNGRLAGSIGESAVEAFAELSLSVSVRLCFGINFDTESFLFVAARHVSQRVRLNVTFSINFVHFKAVALFSRADLQLISCIKFCLRSVTIVHHDDMKK